MGGSLVAFEMLLLSNTKNCLLSQTAISNFIIKFPFLI